MGIYKYIKQLWKNPKKNNPELWKKRLIQWRREPVTIRIDKPTRLDKARELGYKAIKGFVIVRQRVNKGGRMRPKIRKARRPKAMRRKKIVAKNEVHFVSVIPVIPVKINPSRIAVRRKNLLEFGVANVPKAPIPPKIAVSKNIGNH